MGRSLPRSFTGQDFILAFAAKLLARHTPTTVVELALENECSKATAYRAVRTIERHFPAVTFDPSRDTHRPGSVSVRRQRNG